MKNLFRIDDAPENQLSCLHITLFFASLPFPRFYSQVILASFVLHVLFNLKMSSLKRLSDRRITILQLVFFLTFAGTLTTQYVEQAFRDWDKHFAALILPVLFALAAEVLEKYRERILYFFALTCTLVIAYLFFDALRIILFYHLPLSAIISPSFTNQNFSLPLDIHATYLSMYSALSLVCLMLKVYTDGHRRLLHIACSLLLSAGLVLLAARSVFIALVLIANLVLPMLYHRGKKLLKTWIISISISVAALAFIVSFDSLKQRFITDLKGDLAPAVDTSVTDSRMERWHSALEVVKTSPVVGHGSGSETSLLADRYFDAKLYHSYLHQLNAHNEYLSLVIKFGIAGIAVYLYTLLWGFRFAIKKKDMPFLSFLILITVVSFSENILDVNKGIFFYSAFFSLFAFSQKTGHQLK